MVDHPVRVGRRHEGTSRRARRGWKVFAYVLTADFAEFLTVREGLFLDIASIVEASGSAFPQPTEFVYVDRKADGDGQPRAPTTHDDVRLAR